MSDNIPPFDIQMEIIKKVSDIKSLVQFRSVSKPWKSFIDAPEFIKGYGARHTQPRSHIISFSLSSGKISIVGGEKKFICLVDDDNNNEIQQHEFAPSFVSPFLEQYSNLYNVVGACHGLLCAYAPGINAMAVIWNPCIRKSFGISLPSDFHSVVGFGVCPVTRDHTVLSIFDNRHFEVFTLSSGVWNVIPTGNVLGQSIGLRSAQVVIDRFIYWGALEETFSPDGINSNCLVVSFDLVTKEFKLVDLPDSFKNELRSYVYVSKLRESLVVSGRIQVEGAPCCDVWVMDHDSSFKRLFTIGAQVDKVLGFKHNGEAIVEYTKEGDKGLRRTRRTLAVYDPCSQQIKDLGISGHSGSFFMGSYQESLLLLDHQDSHIYGINN